MTRQLNLTIELVPGPTWRKSLRRLLPRKAWDEIRRKAYAENNHQCAICRARGRLECHERWQYDDTHHVQRLVGFVALCKPCHFVKHIGLTGKLAAQGRLDYEEIVKHFMRVNRCARAVFEQHRQEVMRTWLQRRQHCWKVNFGQWQEMVSQLQVDVDQAASLVDYPADMKLRQIRPLRAKQRAAEASIRAKEARRATVTRQRLAQAANKKAVKAVLRDAGMRGATVEELVTPLTLKQSRSLAEVIPKGKCSVDPPWSESWVTLPQRLRRAFRVAFRQTKKPCDAKKKAKPFELQD